MKSTIIKGSEPVAAEDLPVGTMFYYEGTGAVYIKTADRLTTIGALVLKDTATSSKAGCPSWFYTSTEVSPVTEVTYTL